MCAIIITTIVINSGVHMKISIPSIGKGGLEDAVCQHFGTAPVYTVFDTETGEVLVLANTSEHTGGVGHPPEIISAAGVQVMLCGGLGRKAVTMFNDLGIDVFVGAKGCVKDAIESWESGKLQAATSDTACSGHGHGHGHDHHHEHVHHHENHHGHVHSHGSHHCQHH